MRDVLVDYARYKKADKRGAGEAPALRYALYEVDVYERMGTEGMGEITRSYLAQMQGHVGEVRLAMAEAVTDDDTRRAELTEALRWYDAGLGTFEEQRGRGVFMEDWGRFYDSMWEDRERCLDMLSVNE